MNYKKDDYVRCVRADGWTCLKEGAVYRVIDYEHDADGLEHLKVDACSDWLLADRFVPVEPGTIITNTPRAGETAEQTLARYARGEEVYHGMLPNPDSKGTVLGTQVGGSHYTDLKIQPIEYIWANNIGFSEGNVIKYVSRWKAKGGIKDLKKAQHHIGLLIEEAEKQERETGVKFGI